MRRWGWALSSSSRTARAAGFPQRLEPFSAAVPWITLILLFVMLVKIGGSITHEKGVLFDLPHTAIGDISETDAVALMLYTDEGTLLFFDDTRYVLEDSSQMKMFSRQLEKRISYSSENVLLVLADRRISGGELMKVADIAREGGARKVLFAEKKVEAGER